MEKREKVIKGLKSCTSEKVIKGMECCVCKDACNVCPYNNCVDCDLNTAVSIPLVILRDALEILKAQEPVEARLHLCESCVKVYPDCDATADGIVYGCGTGNDNVIGCTEYVNRWKAQEPRVLTLKEVLANRLEPLWLEIKDGRYCNWALWRAYDEARIRFFWGDSDERWTVKVPPEQYGETWRCWSARPTEEQRREEPWQE